MAKKKSAKKASSKASSRRTTRQDEWVFDKHPHLKWLLPLFIIVAAIFLFVHKIAEDSSQHAADTVQATVEQSVHSMRF